MIKNYFLIAWRQLLKNKLYASINIIGLVVGLTVYLFGSLLVAYEENHDTFFANSERTFTAGTVFGPLANIGVGETDGVYSGFGPIFEAEIEEIEEISRTIAREFLLSVDDNHYYQRIRFADPALLRIFDFKYIEGDARALEDASGILLTRSAATKFFGEGPALGKTLELDHDVSLHVTAVVEDLPPDTHFNSSLIEDAGARFQAVAPLEALNQATGWNLEGNFNNLSMGNLTYMLMPEGYSQERLQTQIDAVYERHFEEDEREFISGLRVRPVEGLNTALFDAIGLPIMDSIAILALLVLVVAIANYTNLATAQSLGRAREIGLRKTMGAQRRQLVAQFMVESLCITIISMLIALAVLEVAVPIYNSGTGRGMALNYVETLPWLALTTLVVGIVAGAYPAYLITRASPIDALAGSKGAKGGTFRSIMLGLQFTISVFMLATVLIVFMQNQKIADASNIYPKSQIVTLQRVGIEPIRERHETLRNELLSLPDVESVSFASQLPYEQSNSSFTVGPDTGDQDNVFPINRIFIDEHFLATYDIPLLFGRDFSREVGNDTLKTEATSVNVIINELAIEKLGYASPADAVGQTFFDFPDEREARAYTIVGVWPDQNFQGFHNQIKPTVFMMQPDNLGYGSVRVRGSGLANALSDIEEVWEDVIPDYPIQARFLEDTFQEVFQIYNIMTVLLGIFASIALALSLVGLFGLSAFMAASRTKEIGIRKVMGANKRQITQLLIWQFSRPALWALLVALPLAYFASGIYLDFFADRIAMPAGIVAGAGALAVAFAWGIVAIHAIRIARANPVRALRYE